MTGDGASAAIRQVDERATRTFQGFDRLVARVAPWLFEVGSWIFGGLTAVNLVVISALITVGPVDASIRTSITAFACALPLNVAGICLLRLIADVQHVRLDELALQAFQQAGFPDIDAYFPPAGEREKQRARRAKVTLTYAVAIGALSIALTVTGLVAALWHMAWWIGVALALAVVASGLLVLVALAHSLPPDSGAGRG